ncbi:MAG: hypothetical protein B7Y31_02775 [Novosphingobium sp. 16-62-11]|nr:MAG: hypothetical protein B7Y74_06940 [Novosphingobium sp. 35-62-5]OYZ44226.1 MAG: hypothetical protein B7Y31_02775 [Novosphingobium sp. 16-62-11]OZA18937.1 MAG: hypothetical protein B7X90_10400 [Novosphingobium sp. 17-62-19]
MPFQNPRTITVDTNAIDSLPDDISAAAFRRLVKHLQKRHDAQNIDLMGLAGFCRNCLSDWIRDAGFEGDKTAARAVIHGMAFDEWKAAYQTEATPEQMARMEESLKLNGGTH